MGSHSLFTCSICNYEFTGSGERDHGMQTYVYDTYNCLNCKIIFDYYVDEIPGHTIKIPVPKSFLRKLFFINPKYKYKHIEDPIPDCEIFCKKCNENNVEKWQRRCPKCNTKMTWHFPHILWD